MNSSLKLAGLILLGFGARLSPQESGAQLGPPPAGTDPRERPEYWPRAIESDALPLTVHYGSADEHVMAQRVLAGLEHAWVFETQVLGFRAPLPDRGTCGADERFDVFLWRGLIECSVVAFAPNPATPHDDWLTYMLLDPWGPYGGEALEATLAHELNHACQAADDWWESEWFFEASATFVEACVWPEHDGWHAQLRDFQAHPDWALTHDDEYETWSMYGAALYFHFLAQHYYDGAPTFLARVWHAARSAPDEDAAPDFEDALELRLQADAGVSYLDSVLAFARWRWFTGARGDGRHFARGERYAEVPARTVEVPARFELDPAPMLLGSAYVTLVGEPGAQLRVSLELPAASPEVVVQTVRGRGSDRSTDGVRLELAGGAATLALDGTGRRTLVLTVLPDPGADDPGTHASARHPVTVVIESDAAPR